MKLLVISMSFLLIVSFILMPAFAQPPGYGLPPGYGAPAQQREQEKRRAKKAERKPIKDANSVAFDANDANSVIDPNDPNATIAAYKKFEGLEEALGRLNSEGEKEIQEWTRGAVEIKMNLVKLVQEQVIAEFNFLRELAVEEGAAKTTAAIDGLLADRQKRFEETTQKIEEARRRLRRREDRRGRDRGRDRDQRRRGRDDRSRRSDGAPPF